METRFQTSFIPKKPITANVVAPRSTISIFFVLAVIMFLGSICAAGGVILWQKQLDAKHVALKQELDGEKKRFDANFLDLLKRKTRKITLAKQLLNNHLSVSNVFNLVGAITAENVRYNNFSFKHELL